jgi:hypothetical protein
MPSLRDALTALAFTPSPRVSTHRVPRGTLHTLTPRTTIPQGYTPRHYHLGYKHGSGRATEYARTFGVRSWV